MKSDWKSLLVQGIIAIIFGVMAMAWPVRTALVLVVVWGIFAIVDGIVAIFAGGKGHRMTRIVSIITGIVSIIAGGIAVFEPTYSAVAFTWILGIWLIVRAVNEVYVAIVLNKGKERWLRVLSGVFYLIAGIVFVSRPAAAALSIALWIGIFAVLAGVSLVIAAIVVRSTSRKAPDQQQVT